MSQNRPTRKGFLLIVVLVVVMLVSLACYRFTDRMTTERLVTRGYLEQAQARQAAFSAIDYLIAWMTEPDFDIGEFLVTPAEDYSLLTIQVDPADPTAERILQVRLVSPEKTIKNGVLSWGVAAEAGKIQLNGLVQRDLQEQAQRELLLGLPEMTETLADTILDFIDADTTPREFGTESDEGEFVVRNGPLGSLDDLLILPEVTPALLYGEDANRNGLLDPNENDGDLREPVDNADDYLDSGWQQFLTVWGRESNLQADGEPKINLNADDLETLQQELTTAFGAELAEFVVAYRQHGPAPTDSQTTQNNPSANQTIPSAVSSPSGQPLSGNRSSTDSGSNNLGSRASASPNSISAVPPEGGSSEAQFRIRSLYELVDATVQQEDSELLSPWTSSDLSFVADMESLLALSDGETIAGRIDINATSAEVLTGLTDLPETLLTEILENAGNWVSTSEFLQRGLVDVITMRKIDPLLTTRSETFRVVSIGFWQSAGPIVRIETVFDTAGQTPVILFQQDLSPLGPGYSREILRADPIASDFDFSP